jgi:16S rRNA processing protein RimM
LTERYIPFGRLVGTHGLAGWLKLQSFDPSSGALFSAREITLTNGSDAYSYAVDRAKRHKRIFLLKLKGVDHISAAETLIGYDALVLENTLEPLGDHEYYYLDVIGFDVFDTESNHVGKVTRIWFKEGGDLYVVAGKSKEHLIPTTKEIIERVDLPNRCIIVDLPAGLLDL